VRGLFRFWFGLFFLLGAALAGNALSYFNFDPQYSFLKLKQAAIETGWYLPAYYSHVLVAGIILVIGFFQVSDRFRNRFLKIHRVLGIIYVFGILLFSAPGGMVMAFFINRGPMVLLSFVLQCSLWFYFTYEAFRYIRQRNIESHQAMMYRSFALTLAAITLRIYIFFSSYQFNLAQPVAYATIAWLSWVPNLLVAEWIIRKKIRIRAFD
jgi:uncharacterized membrane protein YozB (DUF420 family)